MTNNLIKIINSFRHAKIGVIGDLMLDKYLLGDAERISPEAPIPVIHISQELSFPGGASNVANNIAALGGTSTIIGTLSHDSVGVELLNNLRKISKINCSGVFFDNKDCTTQKTRIIARGQHIVRIDKEDNRNLSKDLENKILEYITNNINKWDVIVFSDYAKGLLTKKLITKTIKICNKKNKITIADIKPKNANYFKNISLISPNLKEAFEISKKSHLDQAGKYLVKYLNCNVLVTQGAEGMTLFTKNKKVHYSAKAKEVYDIAGAGDTVVGSLALGLATKGSIYQATIIANIAAGIVVGKRGTATINLKELLEAVKNYA